VLLLRLASPGAEGLCCREGVKPQASTLPDPQPVTEAFAQTDRALERLQELIEDADVSYSDLEGRTGFSQGYLAQILGGYIELKLSHVVAILEGLGESPAGFFGELFPSWQHIHRVQGIHQRKLTINREIAWIYGHGVESIQELCSRLERCEEALRELRRNADLRASP
jgi:transcriptional regulator with XRE-family HTH domain